MTRATRLPGVFLVFVGLAAMAGCDLFSFNRDDDTDDPPPPPKVFAEGRVEAVDGAPDVMPQISGQLTEVTVSEGDSVKKGKVLAVIDAQRQKKAVEEAEAALEVAKAELRRVKAGEPPAGPPMHVARDRPVTSREPTPEAIEAAEKQVKVAEARLEKANTEYDYREVKAPISGKILEVYCHVGDSVQPGRPVVKIADIDDLRIKIEVDEAERRLTVGMQGTFRTRGSDKDDGVLIVREKLPGVSGRLFGNGNPALESDKLTMKFLCEVIPRKKDGLDHGQRVTAKFEIGSDDSAVSDVRDEEEEKEEGKEDDEEEEETTSLVDEPEPEPTVDRELREAEDAWKAIVQSRQRLVNEHPDEQKYREELAIARARLGYVYALQEMRDEAEDEFAQAIKLDGDTRYDWYLPALVRVALNDQTGYRARCETALGALEDSDDREILNQLAWTCAVGPDAVDDYQRVVELTDRAIAGVDQPMHHLQNTRGAVLYRAGRFDDAAKQLEDAVADHWKGGTPWDWLFLAMARHQLGDEEDAQEWLDRAVKWMDEAAEMDHQRFDSAAEQDRPTLDWDQQIELEVLRREAETLLVTRRA